MYLFDAGFHEWWSAGSLRQSLVNCSGCAEISSVLEVPESLRGTVALRRGPQLVLLKVSDQHGHLLVSVSSMDGLRLKKMKVNSISTFFFVLNNVVKKEIVFLIHHTKEDICFYC